jgi:hypothetical protein
MKSPSCLCEYPVTLTFECLNRNLVCMTPQPILTELIHKSSPISNTHITASQISAAKP